MTAPINKYRLETEADMQDRLAAKVWMVLTPKQAEFLASVDDGIYTVHVSCKQGKYNNTTSLTYACHYKLLTYLPVELLPAKQRISEQLSPSLLDSMFPAHLNTGSIITAKKILNPPLTSAAFAKVNLVQLAILVDATRLDYLAQIATKLELGSKDWAAITAIVELRLLKLFASSKLSTPKE